MHSPAHAHLPTWVRASLVCDATLLLSPTRTRPRPARRCAALVAAGAQPPAAAEAAQKQRAIMRVIESGGNSSAAVSRRLASKWPKPVWHPPWKMWVAGGREGPWGVGSRGEALGERAGSRARCLCCAPPQP